MDLKEITEKLDVYIVLGELERDHCTETCVIGVFDSFDRAIKEIKDMEKYKENYLCYNCDFSLDNAKHYPKMYEGVEFTDEHFKKRECPSCGNILDFCYDFPVTFDNVCIEKHRINKSEGDEVYSANYDIEKKAIAETFKFKSLKTSYRLPNTEYLIQE